MSGRGRKKIGGKGTTGNGNKNYEKISNRKRSRSDVVAIETVAKQNKQRRLSQGLAALPTADFDDHVVNQILMGNRPEPNQDLRMRDVNVRTKTRTRSQTKTRFDQKQGKDLSTNNNATLLGGNLNQKGVKPINAKIKQKILIKSKTVNQIAGEENEHDHDQRHMNSFDGVEVDVNDSDEFGDEESSEAGNREVVETSESEDEQDEQHRDDDENDEEVILGIPRSADDLDEERAMNNPFLKNLLNKMLEEKLKQVGFRQTSSNDAGPSCSSQQTPNQQMGKSLFDRGAHSNVNKIKSPSDTTIYRLALGKRDQAVSATTNNGLLSTIKVNNGRNDMLAKDLTPVLKEQGSSDAIVNHVSDFVDSVRRQHEDRPVVSEVNIPGFDQARAKTDNAVLEAEKFKATIAEPPGKNNFVVFDNVDPNPKVLDYTKISEHVQTQSPDLCRNPQIPINYQMPDIGNGISDDDFFHLTCFIEPSMFEKIERGEFVDLEKLLPKDKNSGESNRLEWIQQDGATFLAPATKQNKINGIRKWEQVFRVYATIYCAANPRRSKEIWQYIAIINTASASYYWDNVYNYDVTFRHLMAFNPNRSWAVTYNQMWNLSMKDPLP